ncbi:MAG: PKD domain-containing protein [Bacteroidales bacterium]|nr:PKD domain-containing protein [Bacteroidales bacterium]
MKAKYIIFSISFLLIFGNLYSQDCEAWFYPHYDNADLFTVNFQDGSIPQGAIVSWEWDFGDGNFSSEQSPSNTYVVEGKHIVTLTINTGTCTDIYEDSVFINSDFVQDCIADFYYEVAGMGFRSVNFYDNSYSSEIIDSWQWDFGDGKTSTEPNPVNIYELDTTYLVNLFVTAGEYSDSVAYYVSVGDNFYQGDSCLAMFSYEQLDPAGFTFQFYDGSYVPGDTVQSYLWNFGENNTSSEANPVYTFPETGEYEVSLMINGEGCNSNFFTYVFAGENNWYPDECQALFWFTIDSDNYLAYQFSDFSYGNNEILSWFWDFGDGEISTQQSPYHEFETDGVYETSLTVITENCESTFPLELNVYENSQSGDSLMPLFYPEVAGDIVLFHNLTRGNADSWFWDFGDGTSSTQHSPEHSYAVPGIHEVAFSAYKGTTVNTIVIRFSTAVEKAGNSGKGIEYAYYYPGGISNVEIIESLSFSVYPNPANDRLTIICSNEKAKLQIYDITGRLVLEEKNANSEINIERLPAGLYLLKIIDKNISGTVKFIKE